MRKSSFHSQPRINLEWGSWGGDIVLLMNWKSFLEYCRKKSCPNWVKGILDLVWPEKFLKIPGGWWKGWCITCLTNSWLLHLHQSQPVLTSWGISFCCISWILIVSTTYLTGSYWNWLEPVMGRRHSPKLIARFNWFVFLLLVNLRLEKTSKVRSFFLKMSIYVLVKMPNNPPISIIE